MAVDKLNLSGSTNGRGIKIIDFDPAATIHTGPSASTSYDEVWIYAFQSYVGTDFNVKLNLFWGGSTSPADLIEYRFATNTGLQLVTPGIILRGNATPLVIKASTSHDIPSSNMIIFGYVNRIS